MVSEGAYMQLTPGWRRSQTATIRNLAPFGRILMRGRDFKGSRLGGSFPPKHSRMPAIVQFYDYLLVPSVKLLHST